MNRNEHLLVCAAEEGIEVALTLAQRISKANRFGLGEVQAGQSKTNAQRIVDEFHDLVGVMKMLHDGGLIELDEHSLDRAVAAKVAKIEKNILYAIKCGTVDAPQKTS